MSNIWASRASRRTARLLGQDSRQLWQLAQVQQPWRISLHLRSLHSTAQDGDITFPQAPKGEEKGKDVGKCERNRATVGLEKWKLTVGIEVHAQLNTDRKLFSDARTSTEEEPNSNVALYDLALPGSQPQFQSATLIPAIRAALTLRCSIQRRSKFDRKHYFYQDQPAGYQVTQYYEPFAVNGHLTLSNDDGLAAGETCRVGIKQVQMEQDTAKSTTSPPSIALLDFNRVGHPLIEIITLPEIHSPRTAVACVKKIQSLLQSVNAVTTGMELGGLRADVNVSISPRDSQTLGQRVEIKNLSSFQAVEDAIIAERNRQIAVLEIGGLIAGETRGWNIGSTETRKLRGKEGEVDYRYMPDPDIPPLIIGKDLIDHIQATLPPPPETIIQDLISTSGLTRKDATTLTTLDNGTRLDYFDAVKESCISLAPQTSAPSIPSDKTIANWILHDLPSLIPPSDLATLLLSLQSNQITRTTTKHILSLLSSHPPNNPQTPPNNTLSSTTTTTTTNINDLISLHRVPEMGADDYETLARKLVAENPEKVRKIVEKGQVGKVQWFVGEMVRVGGRGVDAKRAGGVVRGVLGLGGGGKGSRRGSRGGEG